MSSLSTPGLTAIMYWSVESHEFPVPSWTAPKLESEWEIFSQYKQHPSITPTSYRDSSQRRVAARQCWRVVRAFTNHPSCVQHEGWFETPRTALDLTWDHEAIANFGKPYLSCDSKLHCDNAALLVLTGGNQFHENLHYWYYYHGRFV